ncbi:glycosyltransferase, partial [Brevibacterium casei]|uniref:glycosyltransferase n=1 Tax=Brevibacterium casei TaxID=33889 RepID=UPI0011A097A1
MTARPTGLRIAAIVPCHNEDITIRKVVRDLSAAVPEMTVYVYDNNSTDNTVAEAEAAGAVVRHEYFTGKGNVIRRAFSDIEADVYVTIDPDDT